MKRVKPGKLKTGTKSLRDSVPEVSDEWYQPFNGPYTPDSIMPGTHDRYWWKCEVASDHIWPATVGSRAGARPRGCPYCAGHKSSISLTHLQAYPAYLLDNTRQNHQQRGISSFYLAEGLY